MKRETSIDLLRCVGLFFVNSVHCFLKNGFYNEPQVGGMIWAADCFRWLFYSCNGIFLLLTGYLKSTSLYKKDYYKSLIPILMGYLLTCVITYPIRHFLLDETLTLEAWINNFFAFGNYAWYLEMYVGLLLISPLINCILNQIKDEKQLIGLVGLMVFMTALPSATVLPVVPDFWVDMYPVTYYVIGAAIRRIQPKVKWWVCLGLLALTVMGLGGISVYTTDEGFSKGFTQGYGGFWATLIATLVFLSLYRVTLPEKLGKVITWLSAGCMEGYLLSIVLDRSLYALLPQWHSPEKYWLLYICVTIPIFIISITAGHLVHTISVKLSGLIPGYKKKITA